MDKHQVAIVIPAFNEEATISNVVQSVKEYGKIIVVNDASTDNTKQVAEESGAIVVSHKNNKGYDGALNSGFEKAENLGCEMVITFDADEQHDPALIKDLILLINKGFKVVVGIRNKHQRVSESIFSQVSNWKWGVSDPLCGMKAYHIDIYRELGHFDSYGSIGTELTLYAASHKKKIAQFSIKIKDREDRPRFGNRISANIAILRSLFIGYRRY
jgi:glycosyltransferase involved in cell wall biosynthesis